MTYAWTGDGFEAFLNDLNPPKPVDLGDVDFSFLFPVGNTEEGDIDGGDFGASAPTGGSGSGAKSSNKLSKYGFKTVASKPSVPGLL
eukprot:tig00000555_g2141.t1